MDEDLAERVRAALAGVPGVTEVKMFGGIGFMLNGNMAVAASDRGLLVRVGKDGDADALGRPGASLMVMNGRKMSGYIRVKGIRLDARTVKAWVDRARRHVETLPKKAPRAKKPRPVKKTGAPRKRTPPRAG